MFSEINAVANEQAQCVHEFTHSAAIGTSVPIVRFPQLTISSSVTTYYCLSAPPLQLEKAALCLRLGVDTWLSDDHKRDRFIGNPATAMSSGTDTPENFILAQLAMLSKQPIQPSPND